jgi:hypothetical protein
LKEQKISESERSSLFVRYSLDLLFSRASARLGAMHGITHERPGAVLKHIQPCAAFSIIHHLKGYTMNATLISATREFLHAIAVFFGGTTKENPLCKSDSRLFGDGFL